MASEPNRYDDFLRRQREQTPPPDLAEDLERKVMHRLLTAHSPQKHPRLRWATVSLVVSCILLVSVAVLRHRSAAVSLQKTAAFEESVVILDDGHVCIWLEPVDSNPRKAAP